MAVAALSGDALWLAALGAGLLATGVLAGLLAGLLGVGGGIVIVPVLFHVFTFLDIGEAVRMHLAVGTSLATIIPTSLVSARSHLRRGYVDGVLLRRWTMFVFAGALAGSAVAGLAKGAVLVGVFGGVALLVAANMAAGGQTRAVADKLPNRLAQAVMAVIIGGFSAIMGIGGGTLTVPVLSAFRYPMHRAVGTAAALGIVIGVPGAVGFVISGLDEAGLPPGSLGYVNLFGFALIVPATMAAAPLGARIAHAISQIRLRQAFAIFLFVTALRMLYGVMA